VANKVHLTPYFYRKAKRLLKKYASLNKNLAQLQNDLVRNPQMGVNYGSNIYKIRIADESKGKGKSGGFRVITYLIEETENSTDIFLITIFDKSEEASVTKDDIKKLIKAIEL
jgi:mRNA-degrading endonuclease RelE of RelBE toxin-antitoxin system